MDIYVGNLFYEATEEEIEDLFAPHGTVNSVRIIKDKASGKPKGFGFVEMDSESDADEAIEALNKSEFHERNIIVRKSKNKAGGSDKKPGGNRSGGGFKGGNRRSDQRSFDHDNRGNREGGNQRTGGNREGNYRNGNR